MSDVPHTDRLSPAWWIVPIAFVVVTMGSLILSFVLSSTNNEFASNLMMVTIVGGLLLGFANITQALVMGLSKRPQCLPFARRALLLIKLAFVPLFLMGGLAIVVMSLMIIHPVLAAIPLIAIPPMLVFGWFLLAAGSSWTFVYAIGLARERRILPGECVAHCILSLFFVADVVDAIVLFVRGRKRDQVEFRESIQ